MKRRRVQSQMAAGWICAATGLVILGVPGAILGGIAGNKITKHSMKKIETKAKADYEMRLAEEQYTPINHTDETLITRAGAVIA
jgi:outer membrane lipoprotein SlyB